MPIGRRWGAAAMIAALLGFLVAIGAGAASAQGGDEAVNRFGACLAANKSGQVLFLMDESFSLHNSDPQAARATAANYLATQLQKYSADSGTKLDVAVSAFAQDYSPMLDWTALDASSLPKITGTIDGLKNRNSGQDTDYFAALEGAQQTLAKRKPANGVSGCQMIAWFTDGQMDFNVDHRVGSATKDYAPGVTLAGPGDVEKVRAAATRKICRDGGVADQLRTSGVITVAIGLENSETSAGDFDQLKSIATGAKTSAGGCGAVTQPAPGAFYPVADIDDLLFAFDKLSTPGQPPITSEAGACARVVCEEGKHKFVLDRSVGSVSILASADRDGLTPILVAPDGKQVSMTPGSPGDQTTGGVKVTYSFPSAKTVSARLTNRDAASWQGVWALVYVAPDSAAAKTRSSIHITGDLFPAWPGKSSTTLHSGAAEAPMSFAVVDSAGKRVDAATLPGKAALSAELVSNGGKKTTPVTTRDLDKNSITAPQKVSLTGVDQGAATLRMTLKVTTAPAKDAKGVLVAGTVLAPQTVDLPITIAAPSGYPQLPSTLDFGTISGTDPQTAAVKITGPGCVWRNASTAPVIAAAPEDAGTPTISGGADAKADCVKVAAGQTGELPVTLSVPHAANGVINGTVSIMVAPDDGSAAPMAVALPFTATLQKNVDVTRAIGAFIAALVLGPLIPLLLLYLVKWLTSRIPAKALRSEQIPVTVSGDSVLRNGAPFAFADTDLVRMVAGLDSPARRLDVDGVALRVRIGAAPFGTGFVVATAPGMIGAAGKSGATHGSNPDAKLPLAVHNCWFVLHNPGGPADAATVVVLAGADATPAVLERLSNEIAANLPRVLRELRAKSPRDTPTDGAQDSGAPNPFAPTGSVAMPPAGNPFGTGTTRPDSGGGPAGRPPGGPGGQPGGFGASGPAGPGQYPRDPFGR